MKYVLSILALIAIAAPGMAAPAPLPPSPFGIAGLKPRYGKDQPKVWRITWQLANYMQDAGIGWDRAEISWEDVQSAPDAWDWSFTDQMVDVYKTRPFHAYVLLEGSAPWMTEPPHTEEDRKQYAEFIYRTVSRYKGTVRAWEIWNEENIPSFWKVPNAADYAALLKAGYEAAKRADPGCTVITGGTSTVDLGFIRDVLFKNGGWDYCDAVAIHPYSMGGGPASQDLAELIRLTKSAATKDGVTKPVWITEVGWTTDTTKPSELRQAEYLVQEYTIAIAQGVDKVFWFTLGDWAERWGLLAGYKDVPDWGYTSTNRTKPAFYALKHLTEALAPKGGRPRFLGYMPAAEGVTAMAFLADGDASAPVLVLWSAFGETHTFDLGKAAGLRALDAHGKTVAISDGKLRVTEVPVTVTGFKKGALARASVKNDPTVRKPGENVAMNPSMELGADGHADFWSPGRFPDQSKDGTMERIGEGRTGTHALSLKAAKDGAWHSTPIPVRAGTKYTLRAWAKPTAATGENRALLMWYSGNMWTWLSQEATAVVTGDGDWREVSVSGVAPEDAVFARITLVSKGNDGAVAWDDVTFSETAAETPAVESGTTASPS
jgi:hypothetical protein